MILNSDRSTLCTGSNFRMKFLRFTHILDATCYTMLETLILFLKGKGEILFYKTVPYYAHCDLCIPKFMLRLVSNKKMKNLC